MKTLFNLTLTLALALPFMAHAQTPTDDIKVGSALTSAGIQMRGFNAKAFPLPIGNWEVVSRLDEKYELSNREGAVAPAPKVVLTLVNKDFAGSIAAAVVTYSPEVTRIRWSNATCEAPASGGFADGIGTNTGSIDYACVTVRYNKSGLKKFISESASSSNSWTSKYLPALTPFVSNMPDANAWVNLGSTHDRGRTYNITMMARMSPNVAIGDSFDQSVRLWANSAGKAVIAAHNGDSSAIVDFPVVPK